MLSGLEPMTPGVVDTRIRRFMLFLSGLALLTTLTELGLENHTDGPLQLVPWVLCGLGLISIVPALVRPGRGSLLFLRAIMLGVALGGVVGVGVHLKENFEFQQEIHPGGAIGNFVGDVLKGAAPLLAPGALTFAALLALAATYYHPLLREQRG
ncbi:MAG TPA: hypothetical protein VM409_04355 [Chloroflexia bacterium]|nr:hypothetical protein [Chloroflexia bacterium]